MATTSIEWTRGDDGARGQVWNPTTGCDKVSPGCGLPRYPGDRAGGCYALALVEQCAEAGVALFVKQLGARWARDASARDAKGSDPHQWPATFPRRWPPAAHRT